MSLNLVESFLSIQGEGASAGRLAVFIRLAGCNLSCKGFGVRAVSPKTGETLIGCDTARAVFTDHFKYEKISNAKELLSLLKKYENLRRKPILVITGGEPLLHHKNEILLEFLKTADLQNYEIHF